MSIKPYELRNGNCKELIKKLANNTIDAIVTDPPYELGFMGKKWDATGIGEGFDPNAPAINRNIHPTVKPTELMRYLCRLVTPPNGLILDPFTGSGSTGKAAILEGFRFLGFEIETQNIEIATARIEWAIEQKEKQKTEQENTLFGAENE